MKRYKVMAYVLSSGLWDALGHITLEQMLGNKDSDLEADLQKWQTEYDDQFKRYPYDFDWKRFNETGEELTAQIRGKLPAGTEIFYEPSDDREFFSRNDCVAETIPNGSRERELSLRERKRSLLYSDITVGENLA